MFSSLRRYAKVPGEEISDAFEMLLNEQVEPVRFSSGITEKHYTAKSDVHNAVTGLTRGSFVHNFTAHDLVDDPGTDIL